MAKLDLVVKIQLWKIYSKSGVAMAWCVNLSCLYFSSLLPISFYAMHSQNLEHVQCIDFPGYLMALFNKRLSLIIAMSFLCQAFKNLEQVY